MINNLDTVVLSILHHTKHVTRWVWHKDRKSFKYYCYNFQFWLYFIFMSSVMTWLQIIPVT